MDNTVERLNQFQKSVIIGTILGDGYTRIAPGRRDAFLEINHTIRQSEYVDWKYRALATIAGSPPKARRSNGERVAYRFYTRQHPEITELHNLFYKNRTKIIPQDIVLDAVSLAVWFMDDGSKCRASDVYLNTQQFDIKSQNLLLYKLQNIGLSASLNKDKEYMRIRFRKESIAKFFDLIRPYVIPSMQYKID